MLLESQQEPYLDAVPVQTAPVEALTLNVQAGRFLN
jgi:hypothetical protein